MAINIEIGKPSSLSINRAGPKPPKGQDPAKDEASFMNVLRDKFSELTGQMQPVPGMPGGIYSFNPPTAPTDDVSGISGSTVSSVI